MAFNIAVDSRVRANIADVNRSCEQGVNQIGASIECFGIEMVRPNSMLEVATCNTDQCNSMGEVRKIGQMDSNWCAGLIITVGRTVVITTCSQTDSAQ